ncbi:alpha beta-hydrolase [Mycena floridula]|nr:alpha beta-hydrolase [Mycena floridula]
MSHQRRERYGNWKSPVTAEACAAQSFAAGIEDLILDSVTSKVYYAQKRTEENGRSAIVRASDHQDIFDASWDARTQVHEYGGASTTPVAITSINPSQRFADFAVHPNQPHLVVCINEDHTDPHPAKVVTRLVVINAGTATVSVVAEGADFYACPRFSPNGKCLAWQQWFFPEMPFQSSEIAVANTEAVSAQEPNWACDDTLFFVSDISGFHNPWKFTVDDLASGKASAVLPEPIAEEFAVPQWWLSCHASGALNDHAIVIFSFVQGRSRLYLCDLLDGSLVHIPTPYAHIHYLHGDAKGKVVFLGKPADSGEVLVELTLDAAGKPQMRSLSPPPEPSDNLPLSHVSVREYYRLSLAPDNHTCHVTFYPPKNPQYDGGLAGEKPPVVVFIHGGPWYMETAALDWTKQFFMTRGWAHIDVNYGGSTGFVRAFRETLHGKWGVLDINDAYQSVLELGKLGLVDPKRAVVHGSSAGGYAVLQIATDLPDAFAAGSPHYGISDMRKLDEIQFEYYLCDRLMGGTWEECEEVWRERSPIYHVDKIEMPLLILQGLADTVIPAEQMINMVDVLKSKGTKVELVLFEGEGHGWRKASTVQTALERELAFFNEVLGLDNTP